MIPTGTLTQYQNNGGLYCRGPGPDVPGCDNGSRHIIHDHYTLHHSYLQPHTNRNPALAGSVEVTSEPTGAMVLLNGAEQGITPITVYGVPIGKHMIKVHSKGYVDNETSVTVEYQKTVPLKIVLAAVGYKTGCISDTITGNNNRSGHNRDYGPGKTESRFISGYRSLKGTRFDPCLLQLVPQPPPEVREP